MKLEDKLFLVTFDADTESHLGVKSQPVCQACEKKPCISGCPADCWAHEIEKKEVHVAFEGCLECGTCRIICPFNNVEWKYPRGGKGVKYRFG
jgi:ferredoxin like protein